MNDALKMQISAFVDGELPENETELLLRRLSQDAELREQVAHYLAIGRLIRQEKAVPAMSTLRARIMAELGEEPVAEERQENAGQSRYFKPVVGFAVAASVALLAIVSLRQAPPPEETMIDTGPVAGITEPAIDDDLLEMHRHGSSDMLSRFVTFEFREGELVEVDREAATDASDDEENSEEQADNDVAPAAEGGE